MKINIHCDTIAQFNALRHIQANFEPYGVVDLKLIPNGIRLTDINGDIGDFVYDEAAKSVVLNDVTAEKGESEE